uniref:Lysine demethylase 2A n=1 Tax=Latimeria chalumnae TaxID=7897 RepID=H3AY59_LATCH
RIKCCQQRDELYSIFHFLCFSGWIHAVYTPQDTLVFGGNFLHSFNIPMQLRIYSIEDRTRVPVKFRYPFYYEMCWYVLERYFYCLQKRSHLIKDFQRESLDLDSEGNGLETIQIKAEEEENGLGADEKERRRLSAHKFGTPNGAHDDHDCMARSFKGHPAGSAQLRWTPAKLCSDTRSTVNGGGGRLLQGSGPASWVHLTPFELEGLQTLLEKLESLPEHKRCVPSGIEDENALLTDVKNLLAEHANDDPELAFTGIPIIQWPKRDKLRIQPPKPKLRTPIQITKPHTMRPPPRSNTSSVKPVKRYPTAMRRRRVRCRKCQACRMVECGVCHYCRDMKKFGGPGRMKQSCVLRQCLAAQPRLPHSVACLICEDVDREEETKSFDMKLMECSLCYEIVHPGCLEVEGDGVISEELPNCWECPKCSQEDKEDDDTEKVPKRKSEEVEEPSVRAKILRPLRSREEPLLSGSLSPAARLKVLHTMGKPRTISTRSSSSAGPSQLEPRGSRDERFKRRQILRLQTAERPKQLSREKENRPNGQKNLSEIERAKIRGTYLTVTLQRPPKDFKGASIVPKLQAITPAGATCTATATTSLRQAPRVVTRGSSGEADGGGGSVNGGRSSRLESESEEEENEGEEEEEEDIWMQKDVWMSVFHYLSRRELCECMQVCKTWYKWCCDKRLWTKIDLSRCKTIVPQALSGIIKRQPVTLDLSWTNISKKQLTWLINRLPGEGSAPLQGFWGGITAGLIWGVPCIFTGVIAWSSGVFPSLPPPLPPFLLPPGQDNRSKLRNMADFRLAGLDITDATLRLIIRHMPLLSRLDLGHCGHLTDQSVNLLTAVGSSTRNSLTEINLAGCNKLTDQCLMYLRRISNITLIDLRGCKHISRGGCEQLISDLSINSLYCLSDEKLIQKIS